MIVVVVVRLCVMGTVRCVLLLCVVKEEEEEQLV